MPKKPRCEDFIIAAIRASRAKQPRLKLGTCAGIKLCRIFLLAKEFYSEEVFRRSLRALMSKDIVILVADVEEHGASNFFLQKISRVPKGAPLSAPYDKSKFFRTPNWYLNARGEYVDDNKDGVYVKHLRSQVLYVIADGLPVSVAKALSSTAGAGATRTKAEEIMASLQK